MNKIDLIARLQDFIESEARSCSMDPGCITLVYVSRMWDGGIAIEEIANALKSIDSLECSVESAQDSQARMSDQRSSGETVV